ncbi:hypothetical protein PIB30_028426 [Stylosanthes scabra]|uniref:Fe-S metabolism associated domain-containing protein n=1 Tax=Stylosanthes scabra TaxID=79078 RepID=A0ABU6WEJ6_9FABA|nr:hypothetical protein [Stylosanthes scabra]
MGGSRHTHQVLFRKKGKLHYCITNKKDPGVAASSSSSTIDKDSHSILPLYFDTGKQQPWFSEEKTLGIFGSVLNHQQPKKIAFNPLKSFPQKLQEIAKFFQSVKERKAKHEQLLFYGKNLKPLKQQFKTNDNKVHGCVSRLGSKPTSTLNKTIVFDWKTADSSGSEYEARNGKHATSEGG